MQTIGNTKTAYRVEITPTNSGGTINAHTYLTLDEALTHYRQAGTGEGYTVTLEKHTLTIERITP
jgi:hypothetical protein